MSNTPPGTGSSTPPVVPKGPEYLGHPQPEVDKRLTQAKNFLADEDPDRFLDFEAKIKEIEDYVTFLDLPGSDKPKDANLLKDVKIMIATHRGWQKSQKPGGIPDFDPAAPVIQPFSNRLISTATSRVLEAAKRGLGLDGQIREDQDVFSSQAGPDHAGFLSKMRQDASVNPASVDEDTNLTCIEGKAYTWALTDPSFMNSWMHPTGGIPNKAIGILDESPWYKSMGQAASTALSTRPARTWLPPYLQERENRINMLLSLAVLSDQNVQELETLLHFHEYPQLALDHENYQKSCLFKDWGYDVSDDEINIAEDVFIPKFKAWVSEFRADGVQLMLQPKGSAVIRSTEPGVFYVENGSLNSERQAVITQANILLKRFRGLDPPLTAEEALNLESLLAFSLPSNIIPLLKAQNQLYIQTDETVDAQAVNDRLFAALTARKEALRTSLTGSFHYTRPGEILDPLNDDLYLPWSITRIPESTSDAFLQYLRPEPLTMITNVEQTINEGFRKGLSTSLEDGDATFVLLLQQVAHPELRGLLVPFLDLLERELRAKLTDTEIRILDVLRPIVHAVWNIWIHGFTVSPGVKRVTVQLPTYSSEKVVYLHENPRRIYCKYPTHDCSSESTKITQIRQELGDMGRAPSDEDRGPFFDRSLQQFSQEHRYPGLFVNHDDPNKFLFDQYMISKGGLPLEVWKYNALGPNGDPTIVYYRGPLTTLLELASQLSDEIRQEIEDLERAAGTWGADGFGHDYLYSLLPDHSILPKAIRDFKCHSKLGGKAVLDWFVYEVLYPVENSVEILDTLPRGRINDGEDGIDDADVIVSRSDKQRAKIIQQSRQYRAAKSAAPVIPLPPTEYNRYAVSGDWYSTTGPEIYQFTLGPLLKNIEMEINNLIVQVHQAQAPSPPSPSGTANPLPVPKPDPISDRLCQLLEQFMPQRIYEKWILYSSRNLTDPQTDHTTMEEELSREFAPWFRAMIDVRGYRVRLTVSVPNVPGSFDQGPGRLYRGERNATTLVLQERAFSKSPSGAVVMTVTAPAVLNQGQFKNPATTRAAPLRKFPLVKIAADSTRPNGRWRPPPVSEVTQVEGVINGLLAQGRNAPPLKWQDSEKLISTLRYIMPAELTEQYDNLKQLDNTARRAVEYSANDTAHYWDCWDKWHLSFGTWFNMLPDKLHIDRGNKQDAKFAHSVRFLPSSVGTPRRVRRLRTIPRPVQTTIDEINAELQNIVNIADILEGTWVFLETALRPLYRNTLQAIRTVLEKRLDNTTTVSSKTSSSSAGISLEDRILIEVTLDIAYMSFLRSVLETSTATSLPIKVTEDIPGHFELVLTRDPQLDTLPKDGETWYDALWENKKKLDKQNHKRQFVLITSKIRNNEPLSTSEQMTVDENFQPLSVSVRDALINISSRVDHLQDSSVLKTDVELSNLETQFARTESFLLWHRWIYDHQNLAARVGERSQVIDPVDDLLVRRMAGTTRDPLGPPVIEAPTQAEITEVEIEVNNLLTREKNGIATPQQSSELEYLLVALLPLRLREWKSQLDLQEQEYLSQSGLDASRTLGFLSRESKFSKQWESFKAAIPVYGMILDHNWYSYVAICEVVSRARTWKEHTQNSDGTYNLPFTDSIIEDFSIRTWHQQAKLLVKHFDTVWTEDLQKVFLWDSAPKEWKDVKTFLERQPVTTAPVASANIIWRRNLSIIQYMQWFSKLTPDAIQVLRDQAGPITSSLDYTPLAERRGIRRAGLELALNLLATNQEQHRPNDRFRIVDLAGQQFVKPHKEVPMHLPLEPWQRPLEQDPFHYTKKVATYRQWRDKDYELARDKIEETTLSKFEVPANYRGPLALPDGDTGKEGARRLQTYLATVALQLQDAYLKAPRPLLEQMLLRFSEGLDPTIATKMNPTDYPITLTPQNLNLLLMLSEPSWDELKTDIPATVLQPVTAIQPSSNSQQASVADLGMVIESFGELIPYWRSPPNTVDSVLQVDHDPSYESNTQGISLGSLLNAMNHRRQVSFPEGAVYTPWTLQDIEPAMQVLHDHSHLYYNQTPGPAQADRRVWRIPLTGHPENRFVPRAPAHVGADTPGVREKDGKIVVTHDATGKEAPPILLPDKFNFLLRLAYSLGLECRGLLDYSLAPYQTLRKCLYGQYKLYTPAVEGMKQITDEERVKASPGVIPYDPETLTLKKMAEEVLAVAPDLAEAAQLKNEFPKDMTEQEAGTILSMQIIEEVSNNWELRFPENEHVWNFADDRVREIDVPRAGGTVKEKQRVPRFFDLKRFPLERQTPQQQAMIIRSGPSVAVKPVPFVQQQQSMQASATNMGPPPKVDRHIRGQQPSFPFGETPYQAAFQSFRMEQDLKDVPEFQTQPESRSLIPKLLRKRKTAPDAEDSMPPAKRNGLPSIPDTWVPDSISKLVKSAHIIDVLRRTPGMPDGQILEHYFTQAQIQGLNRQEAWDLHVQRVTIANQAIEDLMGKKIQQLTPRELNEARGHLKIDLTLGTFIMPAPVVPAVTNTPAASTSTQPSIPAQSSTTPQPSTTIQSSTSTGTGSGLTNPNNLTITTPATNNSQTNSPAAATTTVVPPLPSSSTGWVTTSSVSGSRQTSAGSDPTQAQVQAQVLQAQGVGPQASSPIPSPVAAPTGLARWFPFLASARAKPPATGSKGAGGALGIPKV